MVGKERSVYKAFVVFSVGCKIICDYVSKIITACAFVLDCIKNIIIT